MADSQTVVNALAEELGCEPDSITGYAFVCERIIGEGEDQRMNCSWGWSTITPTWQLKGLVMNLWHRVLETDGVNTHAEI